MLPYVTSHPDQLSLAIPSWIGAIRGRNEYQPKGGNALRLGSKCRYGSCAGGMCVISLCHMHGPYLSALELKGL